jgi:hypothetical protein
MSSGSCEYEFALESIDSTGFKEHDKKRQSPVSFYVACHARECSVGFTRDSGSNPQNADRFILISIGGLWRLSLI